MSSSTNLQMSAWTCTVSLEPGAKLASVCVRRTVTRATLNRCAPRTTELMAASAKCREPRAAPPKKSRSSSTANARRVSVSTKLLLLLQSQFSLLFSVRKWHLTWRGTGVLSVFGHTHQLDISIILEWKIKHFALTHHNKRTGNCVWLQITGNFQANRYFCNFIHLYCDQLKTLVLVVRSFPN